MTARKTIQARRSGPVQEITAKDSTAKDGTAKDRSPKQKVKDGSAQGGAREDAGALEGPVAASGPRIYNLFPLLVGTVSAWRAELPRIAALGFDCVYLNPVHETGGSGSLYAVRDPFRLDARFRDFIANTRACKLYDFDGGRWLTYAEVDAFLASAPVDEPELVDAVASPVR